MTTRRELALLRLVAQRVAGAGADSAADVVRGLGAMQAQDLPGALTSVALRTAGRRRADVVAALDAGDVVRSWPMRGTLHLVPAEDLRWMLGLTAQRVLAGAARRRAQLDIGDADIAQARELATAALAGGGRLSRAELLAVWDRGGQPSTGGRGYHLLTTLAMRGTLCFGPMRDGGSGGEQRAEQEIVLLDEWVPRPRRLDGDAALGEWALRYFRSHGPATVKDFAWWTKLLAAQVRAGVALARPRLESVHCEGTEYLMDPVTPQRLAECRRQARGVHLLPGFDEFLLGYGDRGAAVPAEFADRIVPGGNGIFLATVVSGGQVVGTWKRAGTGSKRTIAATPFTSFPAAVEKAMPRLFAVLP